MSVSVGSVRERRRAETVAEIKAAALEQLAAAGTGGLSLRAVARAVGMTVQSLYHYFDSRDALLSALVTESHHALANAVEVAAAASRGRSPVERRIAATSAFRNWALANTSAFLLLFGTPVPGFDPGPASESGSASLRLAGPFVDVVYDGWTPEELAAIPLPRGGEALAELADAGIPLPMGALAYLIEQRARMHGLVMLELLGQLHPLGQMADTFFVAAMTRLSDEIDAVHERARAAAEASDPTARTGQASGRPSGR
jgi:AcrR family transcriptional regulator